MAQPQVISGQAIGGTIAVKDSAALALLDSQGMSLGTQVFNLAVTSYFVLTVSTAALVPDQVVQVFGIDGYRWINAGSGGGGGGQWLNGSAQYVSPAGNDNHDGLGWNSAKKTGWAAFVAIQAAHGGTINMAEGSSWVDNSNLQAGQVANQGIWLYGPGADNGPGFQEVIWPTIIQGWGGSSLSGLPTPFQQPGAATFYGGSNLAADGRTKPGVWLVQTVQSVQVNNIETRPYPGAEAGQVGNFQAFRSGWNYNRLSDGSIAYQTITSSTRSGGQTTHSVDLSLAATVTSAARTQTSGAPGSTDPNDWTTKLTIHGNTSGMGVLAPPWEIGTGIWFQTSSPGFTSGAYTTLSVDATQLGLNDWSITFHDGSITAATAASPGTVRSIVASPGDLIDLESNNNEFPSTQYQVVSTAVTSSSTGTITVTDPYGVAATGLSPSFGPTANIGRLAHQQRSYYPTVSQVFNGCACRGPLTEDTPDDSYFRFGPMFDIGASTAFFPVMSKCYMEGIKPSVASNLPYDSLRMTSCLVKGGAVTTPGLIARYNNGVKAGYRCVFSDPNGGGSTGLFDVEGGTMDCDNGEAPALYDIDGTSATSVSVRNIQSADANPGFGGDLNRIVGVPPLKITGDACACGPWASAAPSMGPPLVGASSASSGGIAGTPWTLGQPSTWTYDLQTSGKHANAWRQTSPVNRRYTEYARTPANYTPAPSATGISDPTGNSQAVSYDDTAGSIYFHSFDNVFTFNAGDRVVLSGWINETSAQSFPGNGFIVHCNALPIGGSTLVWDTGGQTWDQQAPVTQVGWQFVNFYHKVASATGTCHIQAFVAGPDPSSGGNVQMFGWSMLVIPATVPEIDAAEFIGTLRGQPQYLPVGMTGTFEGQKLIGHGGLGTAARYTVGAGSGQITIGAAASQAIEVFDESGNSLGVIQPNTFTVNP